MHWKFNLPLKCCKCNEMRNRKKIASHSEVSERERKWIFESAHIIRERNSFKLFSFAMLSIREIQVFSFIPLFTLNIVSWFWDVVSIARNKIKNSCWNRETRKSHIHTHITVVFNLIQKKPRRAIPHLKFIDNHKCESTRAFFWY